MISTMIIVKRKLLKSDRASSLFPFVQSRIRHAKPSAARMTIRMKGENIRRFWAVCSWSNSLMSGSMIFQVVFFALKILALHS